MVVVRVTTVAAELSAEPPGRALLHKPRQHITFKKLNEKKDYGRQGIYKAF